MNTETLLKNTRLFGRELNALIQELEAGGVAENQPIAERDLLWIWRRLHWITTFSDDWVLTQQAEAQSLLELVMGELAERGEPDWRPEIEREPEPELVETNADNPNPSEQCPTQ